MAQRLEAALRRPIAPETRVEQRTTETRTTEVRAEAPAPESAPAEPAKPAEAPKPPAAAQPEKPGRSKTVLDNLEEEMASLLGRPDRKE